MENTVPLVCCRSYNAEIQIAATYMAWWINVFKGSRENLADIRCEINIKYKRWKNWANVCQRSAIKAVGEKQVVDAGMWKMLLRCSF